MTISVKEVTLKGLIEAAQAAGARRILLTDYPSVDTKRTRDGFVLVGMLMVVATALDRKKKVIYRWFEEGESEKMVSAGNGRGQKTGALVTRKQQVHQVLREEGFEVDEGEWTPASAEAFLTARRKIVV
jgi:hypothetical protein